MSKPGLKISVNTVKILLLAVFIFGGHSLFAARSDWQQQQVDWRVSGSGQASSIRYPKNKKPPLLTAQKESGAMTAEQAFAATPSIGSSVSVNTVQSPPMDGFIPWVAVIVTDKRLEELQLEAELTTTITGNYPPQYDPSTDYAIGIFDTGASAHLMGNADAVQSGLFLGDLVSDNPVDITGVIDSVEALVSQPIGIFIDGLGAINGAGQFSDTSGVVGMTNTAIVVGQPVTPPTPDLPTAIGSPLAVYYTAFINNEQQISIERNNKQYTGPTVTFYEPNDNSIPQYSIRVPLELRPLGGISVQYVPFLNLFDIFSGDLFNLDFSTPQSPSIITGNSSQSVFFVHSVDITDSGNTAFDKDRFMLDTGAQVTVIGSRIGARLALDPDNPDFEILIQGVTGFGKWFPGFYLDSLKIPALGQWLTYENVPVVLIDIASPEGGTLDGIIGMNLFAYTNMVLRGGGLFLQDDPSLEIQFIGIPSDIAPGDGDDIVNSYDLALLASHWLETTQSPGWNPTCDLAPAGYPDGRINFLDFAFLAKYWQSAIIP